MGKEESKREFGAYLGTHNTHPLKVTFAVQQSFFICTNRRKTTKTKVRFSSHRVVPPESDDLLLPPSHCDSFEGIWKSRIAKDPVLRSLLLLASVPDVDEVVVVVVGGSVVAEGTVLVPIELK